MMRFPLKKQIVIAFLAIILTIIGIDILCNSFLLKDYYLKTKQKTLMTVSQNIEENLDDLQNPDFLYSIRRYCEIQNLSITVINKDRSPVLYLYNNENEDELLRRIRMFIAENATEKYIYEEIKNSVLSINYLELCGKYENGYYYLIKTPIDSIEETTKIATIFLVFILIILLPISIAIIIVIADRITQPLKKLTKVSQKIANLDFSERCKLEGSPEIRELGKNFNKMSDDLEETINTLQQKNINLKEDLKQKEEFEQLQKDFFSNVSHELKTPIAIISGYAESLQDSIDDPEDVKFFADTIYEETQKLSEMVQEILSINKYDYDREKLDFKKHNLREIIDEVIFPLQKSIHEKEIVLKNDIKNNVYIKTDRNLFSHIISNYLTNAIDHINKRGTIKITCEDNILKVFNTGSYIPEEHINKIWNRFFKLDKSRNREFGGTGLGLSIVKTYAKVLGLKYGAKNKDDGVEFFISLK